MVAETDAHGNMGQHSFVRATCPVVQKEENFRMCLASLHLLSEGLNREHFGFGSVLQPHPTAHVSTHSHEVVRRVQRLREGHMQAFRDLGSKEVLDGGDHAHEDQEKDQLTLVHNDDLEDGGVVRGGDGYCYKSVAVGAQVGCAATGYSCGDVAAVHEIYAGVERSQDAFQTEGEIEREQLESELKSGMFIRISSFAPSKLTM